MSAEAPREVFLGIMSGTSADGADLALVDFATETPRLLASLSQAYPTDLKHRILALYESSADEIDRMGQLDADLAIYYASLISKLLDRQNMTPADVTAVGCHGQTIRHRTDRTHARPFTLQLGCPSRLAYLSGITTVGHFRQKDIAAGGQGAPLAPAFHEACLADPGERRAVVNLGGVANITLLLPGHATVGFDTGPGNGLMDTWAHDTLGVDFDAEGQWAATGTVIPALLDRWLAHPYFAAPPPKSTGREEFSRSWLIASLKNFREHPTHDIQATLLELTALSVAQALPGVDRVLVCGGGVNNRTLMNRLAALLQPASVASTATLGVSPEFVEAMAFAWLARQAIHHLPGNLPQVTGASDRQILGGIYPP